MNWVDYAILAIIAISSLLSLLRGFVREAVSLAGWILAFWVGLGFEGRVAALLAEEISVPSLRHGVAFVVLFAAVLLLTGIVNFVAGKVVEKTGLTGTDRSLGMVFGIARGAVIVAVLVLLAGLTALPRDPWWRESMLIGHFQAVAMEIRGMLPPDLAADIRY